MAKKIVLSETNLKDNVMEFLHSLKPDCYAEKNHGGSHSGSGRPDIECLYKGVSIYMELKRPELKATRLQSIVLREIRAAGGIAVVIWHLGEVQGIIERITHWHDLPGRIKDEINNMHTGRENMRDGRVCDETNRNV